ncbi:hypothetical protein HWV62_35512 [Athelia sp. TMB]|nr:hypothetical protein HWV62_35512 [Athelia sp. TMB]
MNFQLTQRHTTNTDIIGQDGQLWYRVETPWAMVSKKTRVTRGGGVPGLIEWHAFGSAKIQCNGRRIETVGGGMFSHSQSFQAADGVEYKWKEVGKTNVLVAKKHSSTAVATFQRGNVGIFSSHRPSALSVAPQGMRILDDVVTTAMWFEEKRNRRQKQSNNAAISSANTGC